MTSAAMGTNSLPTPAQLLQVAHSAIADFGPNCFDSGVDNAISLDVWADRFRGHPSADAARVLRSLANSGPSRAFVERYTSQMAVALVGALQDWPALLAEPGIDVIQNSPSGIPPLRPHDEPVGTKAATARARKMRS